MEGSRQPLTPSKNVSTRSGKGKKKKTQPLSQGWDVIIDENGIYQIPTLHCAYQAASSILIYYLYVRHEVQYVYGNIQEREDKGVNKQKIRALPDSDLPTCIRL